MNKCLNCLKEIPEQKDKTRREKKYCNDSCRASFSRKKNAGKKSYVRIKTFQELKERFDEVVEENKKLKTMPQNTTKEVQGGNLIKKTIEAKPKQNSDKQATKMPPANLSKSELMKWWKDNPITYH